MLTEEVLEDTKALWFSPDGTKMVFTSMDDTDVRNVTLWRYNDPGSVESQYVQPVIIRYPKVRIVVETLFSTIYSIRVPRENMKLISWFYIEASEIR